MNEEIVINEKLATMILYLVYGRDISKTALNKLLFFSDVAYYLLSGDTISKDTYYKKQYGPVPCSVEDVKGFLISNNFVIEKITSDDMYYYYKYRTTDQIDESKVIEAFNPKQQECLKRVRENLSTKTANYLSEKTHSFEPWKSTNPFDVLDLNRIYTDENFINWFKEIGILDSDFQLKIEKSLAI